MNRVASCLFVLIPFASIACTKDEGKATAAATGPAAAPAAAKAEAAPGGDLDEAQKFVLERAQENLKEAKETLAKGESMLVPCAATTGYAEQLAEKKANPEVAKVIEEAEKTCGYDAPLAALEKATKAAEDARAKDKGVLSECFSADASSALEELKKKHAADAKVQDLEKRWLAACPAN